MSANDETASRLDPWRYVAIGIGSLMDLSGETTYRALRKRAPQRGAEPRDLVARSWQAVGDALAEAMRAWRKELGK